MPLDFEVPVRLRGAGRQFGPVAALTDVDLAIPAGGTVGLLGPNGSGKTTMLSLISGLREPTSGAVELFGRNPRDPESRVRLGVTPQHSGIVKTMTALQLVEFITSHFVDHEEPMSLLATFDIDHLAKKRVGGLSGGQQRLLSMALSFAGRPRLVLLDEPSTGLDVMARNHLWEAIRQRSQSGITILLTSHYLEEVQELSDRIVMIRAGRVVADDSTSAILSQTASTVVRVSTTDDRALTIPGVTHAHREGNVAALTVAYATSCVLIGLMYSCAGIFMSNRREALLGFWLIGVGILSSTLGIPLMLLTLGTLSAAGFIVCAALPVKPHDQVA